MVVGTIVLAERIMTLVAGPDFIASGKVLRILIVATGIIFLNVIYAHVVVAIQAQRRMLPFYIAIALLTLLGYLAFIPTYGMFAAAWLTLASEALITLSSYFVASQQTSLPINLRSTIIVWASALLMGITLIALPPLSSPPHHLRRAPLRRAPHPFQSHSKRTHPRRAEKRSLKSKETKKDRGLSPVLFHEWLRGCTQLDVLHFLHALLRVADERDVVAANLHHASQLDLGDNR